MCFCTSVKHETLLHVQRLSLHGAPVGIQVDHDPSPCPLHATRLEAIGRLEAIHTGVEAIAIRFLLLLGWRLVGFL